MRNLPWSLNYAGEIKHKRPGKTFSIVVIHARVGILHKLKSSNFSALFEIARVFVKIFGSVANELNRIAQGNFQPHSLTYDFASDGCRYSWKRTLLIG